MHQKKITLSLPTQAGTVAIWDVDRKVDDAAADRDNVVYAYGIHTRPVTALLVNPADDTQVSDCYWVFDIHQVKVIS